MPPESQQQCFVALSCLPVGSLFLPDVEVFQDAFDRQKEGDDSTHCAVEGSVVPSFSFLIEHPIYGRGLFDLGLRKHNKGYPPALDETLQTFHAKCEKDVVDLLYEGGLTPKDINFIIYSHLHFDHVGDITPFVGTLLLVGDEAFDLLENHAYPKDPDGYYTELPAGQKVRYIRFPELNDDGDSLKDVHDAPSAVGPPQFPRHPPSISPFGLFPHAVDIFADGSLYLLPAPGHMPGHLVALARTGPGASVLLAGDCCHSRACYMPLNKSAGLRDISEANHEDVQVSRETLKWVRSMDKAEAGVLVVLAHERERLEEGMPVFPEKINQWVNEEVERRKLRMTMAEKGGNPEL